MVLNCLQNMLTLTPAVVTVEYVAMYKKIPVQHLEHCSITNYCCAYITSAPFESTSQFGNPNILTTKIFGFPN